MVRRFIVAALGGLLWACGAPQAEDGAVLHRGNVMEPLTLDPHLAYITAERRIVSDLFEGLYQMGPEGQPVLALAQSAEVSDDGLTWTFILREAQWSDGVDITADDFLFGLRRALDPATLNPYANTLFVIENAQAVSLGEAPVQAVGASAPDARTLELTLEYPAPFLPSILAVWGQPAPRHVLEIHGESWIRPGNIVVSGAFDLVRWESSNLIELEANPAFYDAENVCLDRVYYYPTTETATAERRVRNGELDLNPEFSGANLAMLSERHGDLVDIGLGLTIRTLTFNTRDQAGGDVRVRQALGMAVDRRFIADEVLSGADNPLFRYVPEGVSNSAEGVALTYADTPLEDRRLEARELLRAAGYGPDNPLSFTFYYQPSAGWPRIAPVIQQDWSLIADWVNVEIGVRDSQLHYEAMRAGDFVVASSGWVGDFDDPYAYLLQFAAGAGDINFSKWSDPAFDALIDEALVTVDSGARTQLLAEAERLLLREAPDVPVFVETTKALVSPRVQNWVSNPFRINPSRWLCVADG